MVENGSHRRPKLCDRARLRGDKLLGFRGPRLELCPERQHGCAMGLTASDSIFIPVRLQRLVGKGHSALGIPNTFRMQ